MGWEAFIPAALTVLGAMTSAKAQYQAGDNAAAVAKLKAQRERVEAEFEAQQLEQQAGQDIAAAQRNAIEEQRKATLVQSRALALAAASGGGATDPSIVHLLARTASEGAYRASVALYQGEEQARIERMAAGAKRYQGFINEETAILTGQNQKTAYRTSAMGTLITGAGLFTKYALAASAPTAGNTSTGGSVSSGVLDAGTPTYTPIG